MKIWVILILFSTLRSSITSLRAMRKHKEHLFQVQAKSDCLFISSLLSKFHSASLIVTKNSRGSLIIIILFKLLSLTTQIGNFGRNIRRSSKTTSIIKTKSHWKRADITNIAQKNYWNKEKTTMKTRNLKRRKNYPMTLIVLRNKFFSSWKTSADPKARS